MRILIIEDNKRLVNLMKKVLEGEKFTVDVAYDGDLGLEIALRGVHDVAIGSGVEHMGHNSFAAGEAISREYGSPYTQRFFDRYDVRGQGIGAEMIAERWEIPRSELDELALG